MLQLKTPWWIVAGVGILVVGSLGVATTWSYIKTGWRKVGQSIRDATPIAFDLERLNGELKDLEPEIRRNMQVVAQLEVETENLEQDIARMEQEQAQAFAEMKKLREALGQGKSEYQFAGQVYKRSEVEADLARRMDNYQIRQADLEAKKQLLAERQRHLENAKKKVDAYRQQYDQLKLKAESLAGQLKALEATQAVGTVAIDQSRLGRAKELAKEIETRIRVAQRMLEHEQNPQGEIPVEVDDRPVTERFDAMFGDQADKPADVNQGT
ncbi:hypothetical protein THTE_1768 [Thermogutta terrifontis]|jgi:chromosome segregation ATPase|uniref:Chromosome partition protein Smc n=1 Tax=Thermogutta terrifontis TaxID=1331910 RepID=A0A286REJ4_9BACT|nr:hypothetical protein [Thermogutta terrifontis]ASV74370.1 hypothetical protein THTE_1768 [Thermogutta terrifontis]